MPTSSDAQRALMARWFPHSGPDGDNSTGIDDSGPCAFLFARGWTEHSGMWVKPTPAYTPSIYEEACLIFLRDEWDYDFQKPLYPYYDYSTGVLHA